MRQQAFNVIKLLVLVLAAGNAPAAEPKLWGITPSFDKVAIAYTVYGQGEPTLVFIHGWRCDSRYWRQQVPLQATIDKLTAGR